MKNTWRTTCATWLSTAAERRGTRLVLQGRETAGAQLLLVAALLTPLSRRHTCR